MSVMDYMDKFYNADPNSASESIGISYYGGSDSSGTVNIRSIDPLAGDVRLDGLGDDSGNIQSFQAGFNCGW